MTAELRIADELSLPLEAVTEPMGMLAARRAGKSNAAVVIAEEMFRNHLHWVAIDPKGDWWGIRGAGTGRGLPVPIFGGEHGDVPLEPGAGALIADLVVDQRLTCLLDVSGFASEADKIRFLLAFGDRLFRRKARGQEPTHVFFEEADDYVPQRAFPEQARLVHVMARILKQGGSRGLGGTVISQRSAVVHKDILSQVQTLFALRTTGPQDRKAIRDWVSFTGENPEVVESLPELRDGEAWVWSPNFLRLTKRIQFRRRSTFDSGATPKIGESRQAPATLADVDMPSLGAQIAASVERAEAEDPKKLKARIRELEAVVKSRADYSEIIPREPEVRVERVEVPVLNGQVPALVEAVGKLGAFGEQLVEIASSITTAIARVQSDPNLGRVAVGPRDVSEPRREPVVSEGRQAPFQPVATRPLVAARPASEGEVPLSPTARAVLTALAQYPAGRSQQQAAILSGYSPTSGGFYGALALLRRAGYIEGGKALLVATQAGLDALGSWDPLPTGRELVEHWYGRLNPTESAVLRVLLEAWPDSLPQEEVASRANYSATSGGFYGALAKLRKLELISGGKAALRASDELGEHT